MKVEILVHHSHSKVLAIISIGDNKIVLTKLIVWIWESGITNIIKKEVRLDNSIETIIEVILRQ